MILRSFASFDAAQSGGGPTLEREQVLVPIGQNVMGHQQFPQVLAALAGREAVNAFVADRHRSSSQRLQPLLDCQRLQPDHARGRFRHSRDRLEQGL
jgi:hypothetical protein